MNNEFLPFKTFPDRETAENFADVLLQKNIAYQIEEDSLVFDPSYANNPLNKDYFLKIRQRDFPAANQAYENYFAALLDNVQEDYYLFSFSDEELKDILAKPDEWGPFDYLLAQKILSQRGITITSEERKILKERRYKELAKPENEEPSNILGYYLVSFLFFPIGIIIGWTWSYSKRSLPDGERIYAYSSEVRRH